MKNIIVAAALIAVGYFGYQLFTAPPSSDEALLFVADKCPPCVQAEAFLDAYEIEYTEYNIDESEANFKLFRKHKGRSLPLAIIGGQRVDGYDEAMLSIAVNGLFEPMPEDQVVVMYVRQGCGWCTKAAKYLDRHNIEYTEYDVGVSTTARAEFEKLGGRGVPLILVGDMQIVGFNEKALRAALKQVELM